MSKITVITPSIRPEFLNLTQESLEKQIFKDFEWLTEVGLRNRGFTLPSDFNNALKRAKGSLIVILQDCITIEPEALQKIWDRYLKDDTVLMTFPVVKKVKSGLIVDWRTATTWKEKRTFNEWEIDFGAAPKKAFFDVGGFDEEFNKGWSWENVEIAARMVAAGYKVKCDPDIIGMAIDHDAYIQHPFRGKRENNDARARETKKKADHGDFRLNYLA